MNNQQKQELKKWIIENMTAIEKQTLDYRKTMLFLDLIQKNKHDEFIQSCFVEFQRTKV